MEWSWPQIIEIIKELDSLYPKTHISMYNQSFLAHNFCFVFLAAILEAILAAILNFRNFSTIEKVISNWKVNKLITYLTI